MLYAQVDKKRWDDISAEWDEVRNMFQYLHRMTYETQLTFEARMFNSGEYPQYRCTLLRWDGSNKPLVESKRRNVLLETSDPAQMRATLFMLINEAEVEYKAQRVSMIP